MGGDIFGVSGPDSASFYSIGGLRGVTVQYPPHHGASISQPLGFGFSHVTFLVQ